MRRRPWKAIAWVAKAKLAGGGNRLPLRPRVGAQLGTGQGEIPVYLDERGRERYTSLKTTDSDSGSGSGSAPGSDSDSGSDGEAQAS